MLLILLPAVAGCVLVPPRPDVAAWRRDARQAVADVASEVATVDLTLRALRTEDLPGSYAVVVVAGSEESAGAAAEGLSAAQPPDPERSRFALVTGRLGDATDLLAETRIAVVTEDRTAYPDLIRRLVRAGAALDALDRRLADLPPPVTR